MLTQLLFTNRPHALVWFLLIIFSPIINQEFTRYHILSLKNMTKIGDDRVYWVFIFYCRIFEKKCNWIGIFHAIFYSWSERNGRMGDPRKSLTTLIRQSPYLVEFEKLELHARYTCMQLLQSKNKLAKQKLFLRNLERVVSEIFCFELISIFSFYNFIKQIQFKIITRENI